MTSQLRPKTADLVAARASRFVDDASKLQLASWIHHRESEPSCIPARVQPSRKRQKQHEQSCEPKWWSRRTGRTQARQNQPLDTRSRGIHSWGPAVQQYQSHSEHDTKRGGYVA